MRLLALLFLFALSACGADGPPETPAAKADGISITGDGRVGVTVTN